MKASDNWFSGAPLVNIATPVFTLTSIRTAGDCNFTVDDLPVASNKAFHKFFIFGFSHVIYYNRSRMDLQIIN